MSDQQLWRAAGVWALGFLPLAEGNVAIPSALALGLHPVAAVLCSVGGTLTQTLLVRRLAGWLLAFPRVARWWEKHGAGRVRRLRLEERGTWAVALAIPWLGGFPMAFAGRLAGMSFRRYAASAVAGLFLHASVLALLIYLGLRAAGRG